MSSRRLLATQNVPHPCHRATLGQQGAPTADYTAHCSTQRGMISDESTGATMYPGSVRWYRKPRDTRSAVRLHGCTGLGHVRGAPGPLGARAQPRNVSAIDRVLWQSSCDTALPSERHRNTRLGARARLWRMLAKCREHWSAPWAFTDVMGAGEAAHFSVLYVVRVDEAHEGDMAL